MAALRRSDQPARGFYYHPLRHLEGLPVVKGWAYHWIAQVPSKVASLDALEAAVARTGQCLLGRLAELAWADLDAQAVARYCAHEKPGTLVADGYETLFVASRFGTLERRRQVCAHRDSRPHIMPGNDLLPVHNGLLITRGLQEVACLLAQDLPFATAARLLGRQTGEPGVLSAANRRAEVLG